MSHHINESLLLCINFSIILLTFDKREIGLWLLHSNLGFLLKTGTTLAMWSGGGKLPLKKDFFIISETGKDITFV